jgi:hypothetical protein
MSRVKVTGRIVPGDRVTVVVERELGQAVVDFKVEKPAEVCSAGRIDFTAAAPTERAESAS